MPPLILILGPMASGKTSLCKFLFRTMAEEELNPYAIIQENRRDPEGYPTELRLVELPRGEGRFLGRRGTSEPKREMFGEHKFEEGESRREKQPFIFEDSAFAWASDRIRSALTRGCGTLIIDEIGPLEVLSGGGLAPALETAAKRKGLALIASTRPSLEHELLRRIPGLGARSLLRIVANPDRDARDLFFLSRTIIRHCQDKDRTV